MSASMFIRTSFLSTVTQFTPPAREMTSLTIEVLPAARRFGYRTSKKTLGLRTIPARLFWTAASRPLSEPILLPEKIPVGYRVKLEVDLQDDTTYTVTISSRARTPEG